MQFQSYLWPNEPIAQIIIGAQVSFFLLWFIYWVFYFAKDRLVFKQLQAFDVNRFVGNAGSETELFGGHDRRPGILPKNEVLKSHITTLAEIGQSDKKIDVNALISNTTGKLAVRPVTLRSVLSLFIISGLLGTLAGLASSLAHLATLSPGGQHITNESLAQGLNILLSRLGGAFAPSIWGVSLTVVGIILITIYSRFAVSPLRLAVEEQTLKSWAPLLSGPRVDEAAIMRENINAARTIASAAGNVSGSVEKLVSTFNETLPDVAQSLATSVNGITEKLSNDATELADDVRRASKTLKALTTATENLNTFSETFKTSVESLYPFSDAAKLRELYEGLLDRSTTIIEQNAGFQNRVHDLLDKLSQRETQLTEALFVFQQRVTDVSAEIATEVGGTSLAAKNAFDRLSSQNENVIRELVQQVGGPVVQAVAPLAGTLAELNGEVRRINTPLENVSERVANTSFQVIQHAEEKLARMDTQMIAQVEHIAKLSESIDNLAPKIDRLVEQVSTFNSKADSVSANLSASSASGRELLEKVNDFGRKVDRVTSMVGSSPRTVYGDGGKTPQGKAGFFKRIRSRFFR